MKIPNPIAKHGELVMVENYRSSLKPWEQGKIHVLSYRDVGGGFDWSYEVLLMRMTNAGRYIRLYVGDDRIRVKP